MDELTKIALVGTSKYHGALPATEHPAARLVTGLANGERERALLLYCGARAVYDIAGRRSVTGIDPVEPAAAEMKRTASRRLAGLLQTVVAGGDHELLSDCLSQMHERSVVAPYELLPVLFESKHAEVRRALIPVLGARGQWLCRQNPDWSTFHTSEDQPLPFDIEALKHTWDEGTIDQRCQVVAALRRHEPRTVREWVEKVHAKEKSHHRAQLVESLEIGLCDEDEAFLESCLNDRSSAVGQAAARLLCQLPQSALSGRMRDRAATILGVEKTGLILKKNKLVCSPPQEIDRDWERDGISKRAPAGVGERAFWTERLLAVLPPSFWQIHFGMEPPALIAAVADDPFAASVVTGWTQAVIAFAMTEPASTEWLGPLYRYWAGAAGTAQGRDRVNAVERIRALLRLMAPDLTEAAIMSLFEPSSGWGDPEVLELLPALSRPWSAQFAGAFLVAARGRIKSRATEAAYQWARVLAAQGCSIPAAAFSLALAPWEVAAPEEPTTWYAVNIQREIDRFIATIEMRHNFMIELNT